MIKEISLNDPELKKQLKTYLRKENLVPIIGSGFTRFSSSAEGIVPSGQDMKEHMINKLREKYPTEEFLDSFSKIAQRYEDYCDMKDRKDYLRKNFVNVELEWFKKKFLEIDWPYIYTLNIDDAIERSNKYKVVLPLNDVDDEFDVHFKNKVVYKLHGDVHHYLTYKESKMYIFSQQQYLNSLKSNNYMLSKISTDIKSNSTMFIGCSLEDEIDLLFSLDIKGYTPPSMKNTYFVTADNLTELQKMDLYKYGIDTIIKIDDYQEFYLYLIDISNEAKEVPKSEISNFMNPRLEKENKGFKNNIEYLSNSNKVYEWFNTEKLIKSPNYFIERDIFNDQDFFEKEFIAKHLIILYGHRFSGKTLTLINLMGRLKTENVYWIPSNYKLNQETFLSLIQSEETTLFFDSGSIDELQVEILYEKFDILVEKKCRVVICINSSEKENVSFLYNFRLDTKILNFTSINYLENNFSSKETNSVNEKLDSNTIGRFKYHPKSIVTLLDNIFDIIYNIKDYRPETKLPNLGKLNGISVDVDRMVTLIVLATHNRLSAHDMSVFKLNESIGSFIEDLTPAVQFEYTSSIEKTSQDHSGTKVIVNCRYWLLYELGEFSLIKRNIPLISQAYKRIVDAILQLNSKDYNGRRRAGKKISEYIKFDVINDIFPKESNGSRLVIKDIYAKLEPLLKDDFQYFHQRAKSLAWSDNNDELHQALVYAIKSKHDMESVMNDYQSSYAYMHICFTIATIETKVSFKYNHENTNWVVSASKSITKALIYEENWNYLVPSRRKFISRGAQSIIDFIKLMSINGSKYDVDVSAMKGLLNKVIRTQLGTGG